MSSSSHRRDPRATIREGGPEKTGLKVLHQNIFFDPYDAGPFLKPPTARRYDSPKELAAVRKDKRDAHNRWLAEDADEDMPLLGLEDD